MKSEEPKRLVYFNAGMEEMTEAEVQQVRDRFNKRNGGGWEQVGEIGVDAGLCWIGDPCYLIGSSQTPWETWREFCNDLGDGDTQSWNYKMGHEGLGVSVSSGYGDGVYPVYVKRNKEGRIAEARVVFIEEDES